MSSGAPLLVVATSDGMLRFYSFGHVSKSLENVIQPARQLVRPLPVLIKASPGAGLNNILSILHCQICWPTLSIAMAHAGVPGGAGTTAPEVDRAAGVSLPSSSSEVQCLLLCNACIRNVSLKFVKDFVGRGAGRVMDSDIAANRGQTTVAH